MDNLLINKLVNLSLDNLLEIFALCDSSRYLSTSASSDTLLYYSNSNSNLNFNTNTFSISAKISILEFILNLLTLSRNQIIYDKFSSNNFFELCFLYFYEFPNNDIYHNLVFNIFSLFIDDCNENFLDAFLIKSNFLKKLYETQSTSNLFTYNQFQNGKRFLKSSEVFVIKIINTIFTNWNNSTFLTTNTNVRKVFKNENEFLNFYEREIKIHVERMNTSIGNFKMNQSKIIFLISILA